MPDRVNVRRRIIGRSQAFSHGYRTVRGQSDCEKPTSREREQRSRRRARNARYIDLSSRTRWSMRRRPGDHGNGIGAMMRLSRSRIAHPSDARFSRPATRAWATNLRECYLPLAQCFRDPVTRLGSKNYAASRDIVRSEQNACTNVEVRRASHDVTRRKRRWCGTIAWRMRSAELLFIERRSRTRAAPRMTK